MAPGSSSRSERRRLSSTSVSSRPTSSRPASISGRPTSSQSSSEFPHPEQSQEVMPESTQDSTSSKKGRGKSLSKDLEKFLASGGERPLITFPPGQFRPVCTWGKTFLRKVGSIMRQTVPLTCKNWDAIPEIDRQLVKDRILEKFRFDLSIPHHRIGLEKYLSDRFRQYKNLCKDWYIDHGGRNGGRQFPKSGIDSDTWIKLCDHWDSPEFMEKSEKAKRNRSKMLLNHTCGSKSFVQLYHEMTEKADGCEPEGPTFYRTTRIKPKDGTWVTPQCEEIYEQMMQVVSDSTVDGTTSISTVNEVFDCVLGTRSGYAIGRGHGVQPKRRRHENVYDEERERRDLQVEATTNELREELGTLREQREADSAQIEKLQSKLQDQEATHAAQLEEVQAQLRSQQALLTTLLSRLPQ